MLVAPLALTLSSAHTITPHIPALAEFCGWAAGSIGIFTFWPQAWRVWVGRRHAGLSLTSNVLAVLYGTSWLLYGVAEHSRVQVLTNILGVGALVVILAGHLYLLRPAARQWLPLLLAGLAIISVMFSIGARPLGVTASIATISGVLPQAVLLARARRAGVSDAAGVSRSRWLMSFVCNLLWVSYGALVHDPVILINSSVIALLAATIVVLAGEPRETLTDRFDIEPEYAVAA